MSDRAHGRRPTALPKTTKGRLCWDFVAQAYTAKPRHVADLVERARTVARMPEPGSLAERECAAALQLLERLHVLAAPEG